MIYIDIEGSDTFVHESSNSEESMLLVTGEYVLETHTLDALANVLD